jgi:LuxR family transcriptional regulator, maltose regulon positive regulatory protein
VERARLRERLDLIPESTLTLVSAPAGFGKSTLVTEWVATAPDDRCTTAWLSLDQRDNDPGLFWRYLIAALQNSVPDVGTAALSLLESAQSPLEPVLAALLNDLDSVSGDIVLVLDDYHVIEVHEVHEGMAFLIDHLPPQVHLVISSRADPTLPLARLRARGELLEVRAADLRFTPEEAAAYLNGVMGLDLTEEDVAALDGRAEGWIAALQLAALSMQGREDAAEFIAGFAGDDRYIVDYLVGEVLQRQPDDVRSFLLQTSVLSRMNGSLCDTLTGHEDGQAMLQSLERANLFLVPLDDRRHWYRYHHLFADVLRARLAEERPVDVGVLHRRAAEWLEQHGERPEAIRHAMAGHDLEQAADLVELAVPAMRQARQEATLRRWLEALPIELFERRPVLAASFVGARMATGELAGVDELLGFAERWLDVQDVESASMVVVDEAGFRALPSTIAMYRAGLARLRGDVPGTMVHAGRALDLAGDDDVLERGAAASLLGLAHWSNGDLDAAHHWYAEGMASLGKAGYYADQIAGAITLADLRIAQGRLHDAMGTYEQGLRRAREHTPPILRGVADMHVGISELLLERNDLAGARRHLATSRQLGEHAEFPQNAYRWRVVLARIGQADGDLAGAFELLDEAEHVYNTDFSPEVRPVPAVRARVYLAQGRVADAMRWAAGRQLSVDDELTYVREYEHITLARALAAQHDRGTARLLARLLEAARAGQRIGSVIEILVLQALDHQARNSQSAALAILGEALTLAEPEEYVRLFLDEGPPMVALLRGTAHGYARRLLAAAGAPSAPSQSGLVEPLSERELDVLRLLRSELDGPEIARELTVSLNTLRTHTKHIYTKLGVTSRRAAVRRAEELDL